MDVRDLRYRKEFFDLIIDKSTIDALLSGDLAFLNVAIMMKECQRVLKTGGYYVAVSYGEPENRLLHFQLKNLHFSIRTCKLEKTTAAGQKTTHYVYICRKLQGADQISLQYWPSVME